MTVPTSEKLVCARIAQRLSQTVGSHRYGMWFDRSAKLTYSNDEDRLQVSVPNRFVADWIGRHFQDQLQQAARTELGDKVKLCVLVFSRPFDPPENGQFNRPGVSSNGNGANGKSKAKAGGGYRGASAQSVAAARHQLDEFVVGPSNELAFASAQRMAEDNSSGQWDAHPLFIHGGVGLGKTHLLQGLCQRLKQLKPGARVEYTTGERFTNQYITALKSNKIQSWRRRIRQLDLLAVDDVHFVANKQKTQQEFLHCFDAIEMNGSRIVLASDSHPKQIDQLSETLVSRFVRGLVVEIKSPDTAMRVGVVNALAKRRNLTLMETVVAVLASKCQGSIRDLEGTITKLQALSQLTPNGSNGMGDSIVRSNGNGGNGSNGSKVIGHALVNQLFALQKQSRPARVIRMDTIVDAVCEQLQVRSEHVLGKSRKRLLVWARSLIVYLSREMTHMSYPEIAKAMGRSSHSTIVTAMSRISRELAENGATTIPLPDGTTSLPLSELVQRLHYRVDHA
jgi:chromosomal replication initiator protein